MGSPDILPAQLQKPMDATARVLHNTITMHDDLTPLHFNQTPNCTAVVDKHFDGYWTIQLKTAGSAYLSYDRQRITLAGPWAWPCYPGPRIRFGPERPHGWWYHRYIAMTGPCIARWQAGGLWPDAPAPLSPDDAARLAGIFDDLHAEADRTDRLGRLRTLNRAERLLITLAEATRADPERQPDWLAPVMRRLEDLDAPDPDYAALARDMSMATSTLRRRFRAATGVTPHHYRLLRKTAAARALLGDTDTPIKQIADQLGYQDIYYFTRQFKKIVGVPPGVYRKSRQA